MKPKPQFYTAETLFFVTRPLETFGRAPKIDEIELRLYLARHCGDVLAEESIGDIERMPRVVPEFTLMRLS